jgi:hypothetical protein
MENNRKADSWLYMMLPKVIEIIAVIAVIYGGVKVTLAALVNDVESLKCKVESSTLKINTLETRFEYIQETLNRIERKLK